MFFAARGGSMIIVNCVCPVVATAADDCGSWSCRCVAFFVANRIRVVLCAFLLVTIEACAAVVVVAVVAVVVAVLSLLLSVVTAARYQNQFNFGDH